MGKESLSHDYGSVPIWLLDIIAIVEKLNEKEEKRF